MKKFKSVEKLINQLKNDPVYCIRRQPINTASKYFQKFSGKILYAVKTNPNPEVLRPYLKVALINLMLPQ